MPSFRYAVCVRPLHPAWCVWLWLHTPGIANIWHNVSFRFVRECVHDVSHRLSLVRPPHRLERVDTVWDYDVHYEPPIMPPLPVQAHALRCARCLRDGRRYGSRRDVQADAAGATGLRN